MRGCVALPWVSPLSTKRKYLANVVDSGAFMDDIDSGVHRLVLSWDVM